MSQSWKRFLGIGLEAVGHWAVPVPAAAWLRFVGDDSLQTQANVIELTGTEESRSQLAFADGDWECAGDISDIELLPGLVNLLFFWAMGEETGGNPNTITLIDGIQPSATIELQRGRVQAYQYLGMKVNSMSISATARETVKVNLSLVGEREVPLDDPEPRNYLDQVPFVFWQGIFRLKREGGVLEEYFIHEFSLDLENNLRHPFMVSGRRYSIEQTEGVRNVSGSFKVLFDEQGKGLYDDSLNFKEGEIEYIFTHVDGHELKITLPRIQFEVPDFDRGDQDYDISFPFRAFKKGAEKEFKVEYTEV